jgi:uncharacterized membrane protein
MVTTSELKPFARISSLDILRGAIMVLMAIDHVRVYSGIQAGSHDPSIFFTRWVTHFCAPTFVFLAGTAAFFHGRKLGDINKLAYFLSIRGCILVILEITLIRFLWSFNTDFTEFFLAGVIWMLGWCMVLLSFFVRFNPRTVGIIGLVIVTFQQLFRLVPSVMPASFQSSFGKFWEFIYTSGSDSIDGVSVLYVLVPWIGVMMVGYGFGLILVLDAVKRDKLCKRIGLTAILLFTVIGSVLILSHPGPEQAPPFWMRLLSQNKYPASQLFLLMTLGPVIALIPYAEKAKGWLVNVLTVFGRVPLFYYLMHVLIIHSSALLVNYFKEGQLHAEWYLTAPFTFLPEEFRWNLPLLYLVFAIDVFFLYFICRWYVKIKANNPGRWLRYI